MTFIDAPACLRIFRLSIRAAVLRLLVLRRVRTGVALLVRVTLIVLLALARLLILR